MERQFQFQRVDGAIFRIDDAFAVAVVLRPPPLLAFDEHLAIGVPEKEFFRILSGYGLLLHRRG